MWQLPTTLPKVSWWMPFVFSSILLSEDNCDGWSSSQHLGAWVLEYSPGIRIWKEFGSLRTYWYRATLPGHLWAFTWSEKSSVCSKPSLTSLNVTLTDTETRRPQLQLSSWLLYLRKCFLSWKVSWLYEVGFRGLRMLSMGSSCEMAENGDILHSTVDKSKMC